MKPHFLEQNRSYLQWCLAMIKPSKGLDVIGLKVLRMILNVSCKNTKFYCVCVSTFTKICVKD